MAFNLSQRVNRCSAMAAIALLAYSGVARANLVINPTYDSTITSDPTPGNTATIEATIQAAITNFQNAISDNVTASIDFKEMGSGLGASSTFYYSVSYSSYLAQLQSQSVKSSSDSTALAHLPVQSTNPVNGNSSIKSPAPVLRALGYTANPPAGNFDTVISLNTSIMNLSRSGTQDSSKYDLQAVVSHEIDEALAFGSALNGLSNGSAAPSGAVTPLDLFRYTATAGTRSFDTTASTAAYFSLDGSTDLVRFNQQQGGDFSDFFSYPSGGTPPRVQDAYATPNTQPDLGVELTGLDVMGFTLTPEPGTLGLLVGASAAGLLRRRRSVKA